MQPTRLIFPEIFHSVHCTQTFFEAPASHLAWHAFQPETRMLCVLKTMWQVELKEKKWVVDDDKS